MQFGKMCCAHAPSKLFVILNNKMNYGFSRRIDDDRGRTHELSQSAIKCMRGILLCWIRQADRVEKFKISQTPANALHSVFHIVTGESILNDEEYEHLQVQTFIDNF